MNPRTARQGFALITAVVISAAILATIVGIAALTVRETRIQAEQNASDQALAVAERGLAEVVSRFRADQTLAKAVIQLANGAIWELPPASGVGGTVSSSGHSFYWVKVVAQGAANGNRNYLVYATGFMVRPSVSSYTSLQLTRIASSATDVMGRRVVQVSMLGKVSTTDGTPGDESGRSAFDYGLFTGDTFSMTGSKDLFNVTTDGTLGMYAKQEIDMNSNHTLSNLELYAEHAIKAAGVTVTPPDTLETISHANYTPPSPLNFPKLNLGAYMSLFDAFVAGASPFNGVPVYDSDGVQTNNGYPDLSNDVIRTAVLAALGNPQNNSVTIDGQPHHFVTTASLSSYTDKVVSGSFVEGLMTTVPLVAIPALTALPSTLSKSVFYVRNSTTDANAKWQSDRADLAGIIVCSGAVTFTGCPDYASDQVAAVLAVGDIDIEGSTKKDSQVQGIFYSEGGVKYAGSGLFQGQMIGQDTVNFTGSGDVTFKNYSSMLGDLLPGGDATAGTLNGFASFSQNASGWTEKAWTDFPLS